MSRSFTIEVSVNKHDHAVASTYSSISSTSIHSLYSTPYLGQPQV